ncbi:MAG TPA: hypothetical protein VGI58_09130 [Streptosporangiaceae bacterium]
MTWSDVTCPDGTNSDKYVDGCFSQLDTTPPVTTIVATSAGVTGVVRRGEVFALDSAPPSLRIVRAWRGGGRT